MLKPLDTECQSYFNDYLNHKFTLGKQDTYYLPSERFVATWEAYINEAQGNGFFETLRSKIVQLNFPIQGSLSQNKAYKEATLKGKSLEGNPYATGINLRRPEMVELTILKGPVGKIPVLIVPNAADFITVVRALAHKNEPVVIPRSMGAIMIRGINNWDRIHALKRKWQEHHDPSLWANEFRTNILPFKHLYQDTIMVLSKKPYSGVSHTGIGVSKEQWLGTSLKLRMYHEYAHYFTLRVYHQMHKNIYDELLADYLGISMAYGIYDSALFLRCLGLEDYPTYRKGGRMENYVDIDALTIQEFGALKKYCFEASINMERFDNTLGVSNAIEERIKRLSVLCKYGLTELAQKNHDSCLLEDYYNTDL